MKQGWIGVDLDGTLVRSDQWRGMDYVGTPIPAMSERVKGWLSEGKNVRIFTARVSSLYDSRASRAERMAAQKAQWAIEDWCQQHFGACLPITALKDFDMCMLYDDRCVPVETDTGRLLIDDPESVDSDGRNGGAQSNAPSQTDTKEASHPVLAGRCPDVSLWARLVYPISNLSRMGCVVFWLLSGGQILEK